MTPREKLRKIREELQQMFLERAELIDGALAALLSAQHVMIVGPPGTAKSMLADELCRRIEGASYFQWLLTKFTTPEELFGAVSLKALEADDYRRVTAHKLPEAHIAFLDEVFKASSSILNAILTIINERLFHNGRQVTPVPLLTLFGASNELPEDDELLALYDRFLVRFVVGYINEDFRFLKMLQSKEPSERTTLTLDDLLHLQTETRAVAVPARVLQGLADIRRELSKKNIVASDRRYRQSLSLLQALAYISGRTSVVESDLFFLEHVLWKDPGERGEVHNVIQGLIHGYEDEVQELLFQTRELRDYAERDWESKEQQARAVIEAHTKIRHILAKVNEISEKVSDAGRPLDKVETIKSEIQTIQQQLEKALSSQPSAVSLKRS
ncbi:MAG: AAA family ATPase [Deltaproteobacteria bacterium]|nr:AAA family ATPase [Deltaproteobacteria bacterium]